MGVGAKVVVGANVVVGAGVGALMGTWLGETAGDRVVGGLVLGGRFGIDIDIDMDIENCNAFNTPNSCKSERGKDKSYGSLVNNKTQEATIPSAKWVNKLEF